MHGQKHSVCGCRESGIFIVSLPQTACSARLHGFDQCICNWKPLFSVFFYNAFTLKFPSRFIVKNAAFRYIFLYHLIFIQDFL